MISSRHCRCWSSRCFKATNAPMSHFPKRLQTIRIRSNTSCRYSATIARRQLSRRPLLCQPPRLFHAKNRNTKHIKFITLKAVRGIRPRRIDTFNDDKSDGKADVSLVRGKFVIHDGHWQCWLNSQPSHFEKKKCDVELKRCEVSFTDLLK